MHYTSSALGCLGTSVTIFFIEKLIFAVIAHDILTLFLFAEVFNGSYK
jgi:hypothetical protein